MSISLNDMSNPLDNLHKIIEDLQQRVESHQEAQHQLKNETTQELKSRCSHHGGIFSRNVKIFQKHINQSLEQQNPSLQKKNY